MKPLPLLGPYQSEDPIAWYQGHSISCATFLSHIAGCMEILPDKQHVLNLCSDRYRFLVGFAAALLKSQTTLLPPNRAPEVIEQIGNAYSSCYIITDGEESKEGIKTVSLNPMPRPSKPPTNLPVIPGDHNSVIAFTSGSTGVPRPNVKSWQSLVTVANNTGSRILEDENIHPKTIVATVPHQHMYGLETSIMLPLQFGWSFHTGRPFYPEDIRSALLEIPENRILVSTPIHLRACLMEQTHLPELECVLSATAPLSRTLAQDFENASQSPIIEIYGFAEAGTIATRRTVTGENWKLLEGLYLSGDSQNHCVNTPYFSHGIRIPDSIFPQGSQQFELEGRPDNLIIIGGHRASLDDLNYNLMTIEGVIDGVFFMPSNQKGPVPRLIAFAVAPGKSSESILSSLKEKIDPVFLPRPLYLVDALPRNPTGKLPKAALETLAANQSKQNERVKYLLRQ